MEEAKSCAEEEISRLELDLKRFKKYTSALEDEIKLLRRALEFYAKEIIYQVYSDGIPTEAEQDGGSFARQVLKGELNE